MIPDSRSDPEVRLVHLPRGPVGVTDMGSGPVVLAVHGIPGTVRDWRYLGAVIEGPLRMVRVDLPGFGATPLQDRRDLTAESFARAVLGVMDALDLRRVVLLGHSFGAVVSTVIAAEHPERVAGLALLASPGRKLHRGAKGIIRLRPALDALLRVPGSRALIDPGLKAAFDRAGFQKSIPAEARLHAVLAIDRATFARHRDRIEDVRAPSLVAWAEDDRLVEADVVADLAEALPTGPRLVFPEGGHAVQKAWSVEIGQALIRWVPGL